MAQEEHVEAIDNKHKGSEEKQLILIPITN